MAENLFSGVFDKETLKNSIIKHLDGREPDISTAMLIASNTFHAFKDRGGQSYMIHLSQVMLSGSQSNSKIIIGVLHDLIEDTDWELQDLRDVGFKKYIVDGVDGVSKRHEELYFDFIERCGKTVAEAKPGQEFLILDVKLADLDHNMNQKRLTEFPSERQLLKLKAYIVSRNYLVAIKTREIEPGMPIPEFMEKFPKLYDAELLQEFSSRPRASVSMPPQNRPEPTV